MNDETTKSIYEFLKKREQRHKRIEQRIEALENTLLDDKLFWLWISSIAWSILFFIGYSWGDTINLCTNFLSCKPNDFFIFRIIGIGLIAIFSMYRWMMIHLKENNFRGLR